MFQRMIDAVMKDVHFSGTYFRDVVVHSKTMNEHINHWEKIFAVISSNRLKTKIFKCESAKSEVKFLDH